MKNSGLSCYLLTFCGSFLFYFIIFSGGSVYLFITATGTKYELAQIAREKYFWTIIGMNIWVLIGYILLALIYSLMIYPMVRWLQKKKGLGSWGILWRSCLIVILLNIILTVHTLHGYSSTPRIIGWLYYWLNYSVFYYITLTLLIVSFLGILLWALYYYGILIYSLVGKYISAKFLLIITLLLFIIPVIYIFQGSSLGSNHVLENKKLPNIIIIASDSLRADHLSCNGYFRETSPNIDALEKTSLNFTKCFVSTGSTVESWATFLSSQYSDTTGLRYMFITREQSKAFEKKEDTLPKILNKNGYETSVISNWAGSNFQVTDYGFRYNKAARAQNLMTFIAEALYRSHFFISFYYNFSLGYYLFPEMETLSLFLYSDLLTDRTIQQIKSSQRNSKPFFILTIYSCTHLPYYTSAKFRKKFTDPKYKGRHSNGIEINVDELMVEGFTKHPTGDEINHIRNMYDNGVNEFDYYTGRIVKALTDENLLDNTIIIITSDHGDDLYEPGVTLGHGHNFFGGDQGTNIPFIMHIPEVSGRKISNIVRSIDLAPTLLDLIGISIPKSYQGCSIVPYITNKVRDLGLIVFGETCYLFFPKPNLPGGEIPYRENIKNAFIVDPDFGHMPVLRHEIHDYVIKTKDRMIRTDRWKLVYVLCQDKPESEYKKGEEKKVFPVYKLYDVKADPHNQVDLASNPAYKDILERLKEKLKAWMEKRPQAFSPWYLKDDDINDQ